MRKAILGMFMLASTLAMGQGSIEGTVLEEGTNQPVMFANVYVEVGGTQKGTTTDERGKFRIKPLEPGTYDVHVSFVGYAKLTVTAVDVRKDDITRVKDLMLTKGQNLPVCTVRYIPSVMDFSSPGKMTLKGTELMDTPLARDPVGFVASLGDGIVQQDQGQPLYIRGGRADAVKYIIDGMNVDQINIPSRGIGEIAVYTSGIPAKYGDVLSGVIVVETQSYFDLYNQHRN